MASPTFTGPNGQDAATHLLRLVQRAKPTAEIILRAGHLERTRIVTRTLQGVDFEGRKFVAYSKNYERRKVKAGRGSNVNLFGIGNNPHMLNEMAVRATDKLLEIGYFNTEIAIRAATHNEGKTIRTRLGSGHRVVKAKIRSGKSSFRMPKRRFLDANAAEQQKIANDIGQGVTANLGRP